MQLALLIGSKNVEIEKNMRNGNTQLAVSLAEERNRLQEIFNRRDQQIK
jgi:hypothetical protein